MRKMKSLVLAVMGLLCCMSVSAEDFAVDGIYYNITSQADNTVAVTYRGSHYNSYSNEYSGEVKILESVTYNGETYSVTSIGEYAFANCSSLTSVEIPNSVTSIGYLAFTSCSSLTSVEIPNSVTSIGDAAFESCSSLTSVVIGNGVTSIGDVAFRNCSSLTSIVVAPNNAKYDSRDNCNAIIESESNTLIAGCMNSTIPNSVTSIGYSAFRSCSSLTSVEIPNSVTSIGDAAFESCSSLTSVEIPNSVTSIGNYAFSRCSSLTSVEIPNSVTSISGHAFDECSSLTSVEIPNSVTSIGTYVFYKCSNLTSVEITNSVTSIGDGAFSYCSSLTSVEIPNSVTSIGSYAFSNCSSLTSVEIPDSVTSIGEWAFSYCSSLTSVEIPNSVTSIGNSAFSRCSSLTSVEIPNSVTSISGHAFDECSSLTSVEIPNSVTSIGDGAFRNCSSLTSVEIPNSVTSIGTYVFYKCSNLTSVEIPNSVTSIGNYAFSRCSSLTSVEIGNSVTSIGNYAFSHCSSLTKVRALPTTAPSTTSPATIFDNCTNLTTIYIPKGSMASYNVSPWNDFDIVEIQVYMYMTLVDGEAYAEVEENKYNEITYTRNFKNTYYQPLYVPFDINYDDIKDRFAVAELNDIHHYDDDEDGVYDRWALEVLRLKSGDVVQANTPYVIKAKTTGEQSIVVEDAILYPAELNTIDCSSTKVLFTFVPTYTAISGSVLREDGGYVLGSGKLLIPTESTTVKPFRWYLRSESRNGGGQSFAPKQILLFERGEGGLTHIENFTEDANHASWPADVYDTNGRLIRKAAHNLDGLRGGVYIVNGKKIVK